MALNPVTDDSFQEEVLQSSETVLVKFTADWCGPCRQFEPILQELAPAYEGRVAFRSLDVDENPATAAAYHVTGIPTVKVFRGGEEILSLVGARPKSALQEELDAAL